MEVTPGVEVRRLFVPAGRMSNDSNID